MHGAERMRKHAVLLAFAALLGTTCAWGAQQHPARGIVIQVGKAHRSLVVSCDAIPGYMDPMEMSFAVRDSRMLAAIKPGTTIRFTIVEGDHVLYADNLQAITAANLESEPMEAGGLTMLQGALNPSSAAQVVAQGQSVPDFELTDQEGKRIHLSSFLGRLWCSHLAIPAVRIRSMASASPPTWPRWRAVSLLARGKI